MNYFIWFLAFAAIAIPFSYYPNKGEAPSDFRKRRLDIAAGNIIGAGSSLVGLAIALIIWGTTMYGIVYGLTIEAVLAVALMPIYFGFYRKKYYQKSDSGDVAVFGFALSTGLMIITLIALLIVGQVNNYSGLNQAINQSSSSPIEQQNPVVSAVVTPGHALEYETYLFSGILVVDSQGRRAGSDGLGHWIYEIPDSNGVRSGACVQYTACDFALYVPITPGDRYTVYLFNSADGTYDSLASVVDPFHYTQAVTGTYENNIAVFSQNPDLTDSPNLKILTLEKFVTSTDVMPSNFVLSE